MRHTHLIQRVGPHADGIVGSTQTNPAEQLTKQLQQLSIQHTLDSQTIVLAAPPIKTLDVHIVKSKNPKAANDPGGYRWPPTFFDWLKTVFWQFWQFTIFSRF
jgi:hypothetical protein